MVRAPRSPGCDSDHDALTPSNGAAGPHRVLTQEASTPKKDFYAWYQQATLGPCPTSSPPPGATKLDISKWCGCSHLYRALLGVDC